MPVSEIVSTRAGEPASTAVVVVYTIHLNRFRMPVSVRRNTGRFSLGSECYEKITLNILPCFSLRFLFKGSG